tara:strand:- start:34962 stop:35891 length:930 start_codon:yes stop_codon:yes gene_type:complete
MKTIYKKLSVVFLALVVFACETENTVIDDVFDTVQNGAILRQVSSAGAIDLVNPSSTVSVTLEYQDAENESLLSNVEVYLSFVDKNGADDSVGQTLLATLSPSDFSPSLYNLPETTFTYSFAGAMSTLGLVIDQINAGDQFVLNFQLNLTDGRSYGSDNANGNVSAVGGYYSSPYRLTSNVVCLLPDGYMTGAYTLTETVAGGFGAGTIVSGDVIIDAPGPTTRTINFTAYGMFGGFGRTWTVDLVCGEFVIANQSMSLACGDDGIFWGPAPGQDLSYDVNDDSSYTFVVAEDGGSCGYEVEFEFTLTR